MKLSLVQKLFILTGWLIINMLIVGGFSYWNETRLAKSLKDISVVQLPATRHMGNADMMHDGLAGLAYQALWLDHVGGDEEPLMEELKDMTALFHDSIAQLDELPLSKDLRGRLERAKPVVGRYIATVSQIVRLASMKQRQEAESLIPQMKKDFDDLEVALGEFGEAIESQSQAAAAASIQTADRATFWGFMIIVVGLVFGVAVSALLIRRLVASLRALMAQLTTESAGLKAVSSSIERASQTLSSSTQREAAAVQQTASSLQETSAMVKKTSENAEHSHGTTQTSAKLAQEGLSQVQEMMEAMSRIDHSSETIGREISESNQKISEIVKLINEIGAKTKVINDIVFQTKLLSFNASVEAARAGEHGKGFAVVAEEVGNLAQMSGNAAREINEMLSSSISKVERIIDEMKSKVERLIDSSRSEVKTGNQIAEKCESSIQKVAEAVVDINRRVAEITTAAQEQAAGVQEISKALNELDQVTHTNARTATEASELALELTSRSETLLRVVSGLQELLEGEKDVEPVPAVAKDWSKDLAVKVQSFSPPAGEEPKGNRPPIRRFG